MTTTDFFWRYTYHTATKRFSPEQVPVYCSCERPENPDIYMAECDMCLQWFHPYPCEGVDPSEVQATGKFMCRRCRARIPGASGVAAQAPKGLGQPPSGGAAASSDTFVWAPSNLSNPTKFA